jgi:hypothetical protein
MLYRVYQNEQIANVVKGVHRSQFGTGRIREASVVQGVSEETVW